MTVVQIQAHLSMEELLKAIGQLSPPELEIFVQSTLILRAQRQAPHVNHAETELLRKINQGLPLSTQKRYAALIAKRRAETLTAEEYQELLKLTNDVENFEAQRVVCLTELAQLRQVTLEALMQQLGIKAPEYA